MNAWEQNDKDILEALFVTFAILREASYEGDNRQLSGLLQNLEDVTRDAMTGFRFPNAKHIAPTVEDIRLACS
jgi:hypothetical protein